MTVVPNADYLSNIEEPLVVASSSEVHWDDEADLVVVGFGGAGVAAALEGRDQGVDVLAVDRFEGGGATVLSGGVVYAGGTRHQRAAGFADSAEDMFNYLSLEESAVDPATLRAFCEGSNGDLEWLEGHGVPFSSEACLEKTSYPPDGKFLYYSGNEKVPAYAAYAKPAPRGHRVVGPGYSGGVYYSALKASALAKGVRFQAHSPARRLLVTEEGTVLGVEVTVIPPAEHVQHEKYFQAINPAKPFAAWRDEKRIEACGRFERRFKKRRRLRARLGVILAAGGFIYNLQMVQRHHALCGQNIRSLARFGSMGCDGSGIDLGRSVGGATALMETFFIGRIVAPPSAFLSGLLVDSEGRRFINEEAYSGFVGAEIARLSHDGRAWLILDRLGYSAALHQALFPGRGLRLFTLPSLLNMVFGGTRKAQSLDELSRRCQLNSGTLGEAVRQNNRVAAGEITDAFGKTNEHVRPISKAPFYAVNMDFGNKFQPTIVFTLGGLKVDEASGIVVRTDGVAVGGLYAAGRTAVGLCSKGYLSGMSLADTVFSGRRAARSAVQMRSVGETHPTAVSH